jgi:hypothetical protein
MQSFSTQLACYSVQLAISTPRQTTAQLVQDLVCHAKMIKLPAQVACQDID